MHSNFPKSARPIVHLLQIWITYIVLLTIEQKRDLNGTIFGLFLGFRIRHEEMRKTPNATTVITSNARNIVSVLSIVRIKARCKTDRSKEVIYRRSNIFSTAFSGWNWPKYRQWKREMRGLEISILRFRIWISWVQTGRKMLGNPQGWSVFETESKSIQGLQKFDSQLNLNLVWFPARCRESNVLCPRMVDSWLHKATIGVTSKVCCCQWGWGSATQTLRHTSRRSAAHGCQSLSWPGLYKCKRAVTPVLCATSFSVYWSLCSYSRGWRSWPLNWFKWAGHLEYPTVVIFAGWVGLRGGC